MKIINVLYVSVVAFVLFAGCESARRMMTEAYVVPPSQLTEEYTGQKFRVIVSPIKNYAKSSTGEKLKVDLEVTRDQLITALTQTGVFTVVRTNERVGSNGASPQGAQYLIEVVLAEYEQNEMDVHKRKGSSLDNIIELFNLKQDYIAMNIHLADIDTGDIVSSKRIVAYPKDFKGSRGDIGSHITTPVQKTVWACMDKAARWAAKSVKPRTVQQ